MDVLLGGVRIGESFVSGGGDVVLVAQVLRDEEEDLRRCFEVNRGSSFSIATLSTFPQIPIVATRLHFGSLEDLSVPRCLV